jgi:hypothetical protein
LYQRKLFMRETPETGSILPLFLIIVGAVLVGVVLIGLAGGPALAFASGLQSLKSFAVIIGLVVIFQIALSVVRRIKSR